jgi:hypothetical protein
MFANTTPFQIAVKERRGRLFEAAQNELYAQLTRRFQGEASKIQSDLEEAIRKADVPRDYRTPVWTYNSLGWARSYQEAVDLYGANHCATIRAMVEEHGHETALSSGAYRMPVHRLMKERTFLPKLGAFFGDHFTVSLRVTRVLEVNQYYTAVEQTLYLHYWPAGIPAELLRARSPEEQPPSPVPVIWGVGGEPVCFCHHEPE